MQADEHREWADEQHRDGDEGQPDWQHPDDLVGIDAPGKHDEQRPDEQDLQMLLELDDDVQLEVLVGQEDAEQGHRHEPGLLLDEVGTHDGATGHRDEDDPLQEVRDEQAPQHEGEQHADGEGDEHRDHHRPAQHGQPVADVVAPDGRDRLVDQQGEDRADGVDDDALPAQQGRDPSGGAHLTQDRVDHRGAGDDEQGPQQQGDPDVHAEQMRGKSHEKPCDDDRHRAQSEDGFSEVTHLPELEGQRSLEEDDGHSEVHPAEEQTLTEHLIGSDPLTECETDYEQEEQRGQLESPAEPLSSHGQHQDEGQVRCWIHFASLTEETGGNEPCSTPGPPERSRPPHSETAMFTPRSRESGNL